VGQENFTNLFFTSYNKKFFDNLTKVYRIDIEKYNNELYKK